MPKRKTLKQIVAEASVEIQSRHGPPVRPLTLDLPLSSTEDDTFYPEFGSPLAEYERTHFKGKR